MLVSFLDFGMRVTVLIGVWSGVWCLLSQLMCSCRSCGVGRDVVGWRLWLLVMVVGILAGGCGGDSSLAVPSVTSVPVTEPMSEAVRDSGVVEESSGARPEAVEDTGETTPETGIEEVVPVTGFRSPS